MAEVIAELVHLEQRTGDTRSRAAQIQDITGHYIISKRGKHREITTRKTQKLQNIISAKEENTAHHSPETHSTSSLTEINQHIGLTHAHFAPTITCP